MLDFAIQTARDAGAILADRLGRALTVSNKGDIDLVAEADLASEKLIIERIRSHYPRHAILAEESGCYCWESSWCRGRQSGGGSSIRSMGPQTTRTAIPAFCVSIALERSGAIEVAAIYDPTRDEMFAAERGQGAHLNGRRVRVSAVEDLNSAMLCTGFPTTFENGQISRANSRTSL